MSRSLLSLCAAGIVTISLLGLEGCSDGEGSTASGGTGGTGSASPCAPCGTNEDCEVPTATCQCKAGFIRQNGSCEAAPPGDPAARAETEVCDQWKAGHVVTTPDSLEMNETECNPGALKQGAITDTLTRMNAFRWLAGLGPTVDDPVHDAGAQLCANLEAWWFDGGAGSSPHMPEPASKCYTADGASYAGMSNIAWGSGSPADAIDQFMLDDGNETTLGHRRWIVNPPLAPVGIGYWQSGGQYGNAECLYVFGMMGMGPHPAWVAVPNQGFVPAEIAQWTWSFHSSLGGAGSAKVSVLRVDDNTPVTIDLKTLSQGYGEEAISWTLQEAAEAGKTYRVTVSGVMGGDIVYDVKPVSCN